MTEMASFQGTYRNISSFDLHRPTSIAEVCELTTRFGENYMFMGGGLDVLQMLKSGMPVENLIYLKTVPELNSVEIVSNMIRVGACVTHHAFEIHPAILKNATDLAHVWKQLGNIRIRIAGTIGGNILANSASYDALPAFLALDAVAHFEDSKGSWCVSIENVTKTKQFGLLTAIEFAIGDARVFSMDRSLKPVTSVAISAEFSRGLFKNIRVGIGCAFSTPLGRSLHNKAGISPGELIDHAEELARAFAAALPEPVENVFASASYRRRMIAVILARQLLKIAKGHP